MARGVDPAGSDALAVVQARFGSTRLPGKVLADLAGRTVLARVLERVGAVPGVGKVVCAVADDTESDPVAREATACGVAVFRGDQRDVLDRTWRAAQSYRPRIVMRVTSDCPLVDPAVCGRVLRLLADDGADYACNATPPSFPHGLDCEAFTFAWLERAAREARKPSEREHVTPFIRNHAQARKVSLKGPGGDAVEQRWTLDTPADLAFLRALYEHMPEGPAGWDFEVPLGIVRRRPELARINAGHDRYQGLRKSLAEDDALAQGAGSRR